ncbi:MAG: Gfo/Idh/MocA family oxidoreductase [Clostridia bacterium]|nr:Gfo/Idh/MocA family oxidoreductase [Clostridia bacterium]
MRIGVICPSEIAFRRFMPALGLVDEAKYAGVAVASGDEWFGEGNAVNEAVLNVEREKAEKFKEAYGGKIYESYGALLDDGAVDAVYLPLPPALHYRWADSALDAGKHIFVEKPATISAAQTAALSNKARKKGLAMHENYMFNFHSQIEYIEKLIASGDIGNVRLYTISFGFPRRASNDFRYNKALGGGALLDCGGYTVKLASRLLGESAKILASRLGYCDEFQVDMFGTIMMANKNNITAQLSFGMDNEYKCSLEVWGSAGTIFTNRILTAPAGFKPTVTITRQNESETVELDSDDTFKKSIEHFLLSVKDNSVREANYAAICRQSEMIDEIKEQNKNEEN